jgi:glutathione synthase/RimK-type ligase-like ATP-grasp enzyme
MQQAPENGFSLIEQAQSRFLALAPFLRLNIAGVDLRPMANALLDATRQNQDNAFLWLNLSTLFFILGENRLAASMQAEALAMQRLYFFAAARQPAQARLLVIVAPGDLGQNIPIDCLLEDSGIDLIFYFAEASAPLPGDLVEYDAVMVAVAQSEATQALLLALEEALNHGGKPVINRPRAIFNVERNAASHLLQGVPGLTMPLTHSIARPLLAAIAAGEMALATLFADCRFPIILRPIGSHAGHSLEKIDNTGNLSDYLQRVPENDFYIANFIDYRNADGLFRKYRIALVKGEPFIAHMAISSHWMIHYLNAGMYEDEQKRREEARFMDHFPAFAEKHRAALAGIYQRAGLEYFCIDCAETPDGALLIFEIDHAMVVHAMDSAALFPHKPRHIIKIRQAVENLILNPGQP